MVTTTFNNPELSEFITREKTCKFCAATFTATFPRCFAVPGRALFDRFNSPEGCCSPCADVQDAKQRDEEMAKAAAEKLALRREMWAKKVPPIFNETQFERLPASAKKNLAVVANWKYGPRGLILAGPTGGGKSRLFWTLAERLYVDEGRKMEVMSAPKFTHECGRAFGHGGEAEQWVDRLIRADVFMLDDVAKGKLTDRVQSELFYVIDERMSHRRPIILTMNHTGETLASALSDDIGAALVRRLRECCDFISFQ